MTAKWEELYSQERRVKPKRKGVATWGQILSWNASTLLIAPHATAHWRKGKVKSGEPGTGSLVQALALEAEQDALWLKEDGVEVSWDKREDRLVKGVYNALKENQVVLDFHGMKDDYNLAINIGTGEDEESKVGLALKDTLMSHGINPLEIGWNSPFDGKAPYTVTSYVQRLGHNEVLQLEIARSWREPGSPKSALLFGALLDYVSRPVK